MTTALTECSPGKITLKCFNLGLLASAVYIIATWLPMRVCFLDVLEMSLEKYWEICGLRFLKEHLSPWLAAKWHGHRGRPSYRIMKRYRGQTKLDVYFICRLVYLLCRIVSLWLCLFYFGDILKYRMDPELDFGFWEKNHSGITLLPPPFKIL